MPGFLGGSSGGGGGTGGEIRFPKEFIDPVTKLRVSQPETLIDTDFEYGLQPTKWETLELINNTPSFFSKSGDTTIPGIVSITTNSGTREITVTTALDHGLAVGIPINVQGTKSVTADGSFIINSIPDTTTFTYLCKDNQAETLSIEDLYTSIVTGEFFQGAQLRISDSEGIITDNAAVSELTVKTESAHGFGVNTPFYFLNLNSTVAQEFEATNTAAKSFDSSNSATAQTFDGSNTLSQIQVDFSNSATVGGTTSEIVSTDAGANTITVTHTTETFVGSQIGTPLYYDVVTSAGYFATNPRGVVFLKTTNQLASGTSIFQVSEIPDGDAIDIEAAMTGTFQLANQARIFAGNNVNTETQAVIDIVRDNPIEFEAANNQSIGGNGDCTVTSYSGSLVNVSVSAGAGLDYYQGAMVLYSTDGATASGLTNNTTYFVDSFFSTGTDTYAFTLKELPTDESALSISGGTGTQTFSRIGISLDKDIVHIKDSFYGDKDMLEYSYPVGGAFEADAEQNFYFVSAVYDQHNYQLNPVSASFISATGGDVIQTIQDANGRSYTAHRFTTAGTYTFTVTDAGTFDQTIKYVVTNGSYDGDTSSGEVSALAGNYTIVVNSGGRVDIAYPQDEFANEIAFTTIYARQPQASGGSVSDITIDNREYRVHKFTSTGTSTFTVTDPGDFGSEAEYLIVAGGGAAGANLSGGGGGGGVVEGSVSLSAQSYSITVGAGGTAPTGIQEGRRGGNGGNSSAFGKTALGGGGSGAGTENDPGRNGGSGGGAGGYAPIASGGTGLQPTSASGGFGNNGGSAGTGGNYGGGGGGGAGTAGQSVSSGSAPGGNGGDGRQSNIDGNNYYYGGGGGGGSYTGGQGGGDGGLGGGGGGGTNNGPVGVGGTGGINNGGNGVLRSFSYNPGTSRSGGNGGANTGGGGGGGPHQTWRGGNGGSGIVIVRYPLEPAPGGN